jgi:hypothetical protein
MAESLEHKVDRSHLSMIGSLVSREWIQRLNQVHIEAVVVTKYTTNSTLNSAFYLITTNQHLYVSLCELQYFPDCQLFCYRKHRRQREQHFRELTRLMASVWLIPALHRFASIQGQHKRSLRPFSN